MKLSVIGLGKLGSPMAAVFAAAGHEVIGLDLNPDYVAALAEGRAPVEEPQLQEMIDAGRLRLSATSSYDEAVQESDITFIIVPTPSAANGHFSNRFVLEAVEAVGDALRRKEGYHLVVVTSTVMPGSTGGPIAQALTASSGRKIGDTVGLCYNPEFIALGSVVRDMLHPDFILIGESDAKAGELLAQVYATSCAKNPVIRRMNWINAEITKISVNTYVTTKISYANMLADLCDRLPGADVSVVSEAVGSDSRIGRKYLTGATGYGGPCFPRDNIAFTALAESVGARADLARATDGVNRYQVERLTALVRHHLGSSGRVAVLGLSYKPETYVVEESQGVALARALTQSGYEVAVHDPQAVDAARAVLGRTVHAALDVTAAVEFADLVIIMTAWSDYAALPRQVFERGDRSIPVVDCWGVLKDERYPGLEIIRLGAGAMVGSGDTAAAAQAPIAVA
jgi:UDPglucose 6-dehydrogenase